MGIKTGELHEGDGEGRTHRAWMVMCPACGYPHVFDSRWGFDGNHEAPTFTPSMKVNTGRDGKNVCHSFLAHGVWNYGNDCTHALKGKTAPAPDWVG